MKIKSKSFALILSLAMFLAYIPAFAFADDALSGEGGESGTAVAQINDVEYATLPEAVAAAEDGDTITLLKDAEGDGVAVMEKDAKELTLDFGGHTYTMNGKPVGSSGTENQAMHFEKGSFITLQNGTLKVVGGKMGIQNYADLNLQDFNVDASMNDKCTYALSCNNGYIDIKGNSSIKAADGKNAFDVCVTTNYPDGARVTVNTTGEIVGNIQYDVWDGIPEENETALNIYNGKFIGKFDVEDALKDAAKENFWISGGIFSEEVPEEYLDGDSACLARADGRYEVLAYSDAVKTLKDEKAKAEADAKAAAEKVKNAEKAQKAAEEAQQNAEKAQKAAEEKAQNAEKAQKIAEEAQQNAEKAQKAAEEKAAELQAQIERLKKETAPGKTSIKKLTAGKKKFTATWKTISGVKGYQIQYSTSKNFSKKTTKSKTVKSYKTKKQTVSKLKAKKTYYVHVRTYKTVDGKTVYSGWSSAKKVKTK